VGIKTNPKEKKNMGTAMPNWLLYVVPIIVIQLILMVVALLDLSKRERTKGPKWMWALIIILGELLGPILYFVLGREE
jgi:hypothetical protein